MSDRTLRGLMSLSLSIAMLAVGAMAGRIFPADTAYVMPLFVFAAAIFLADSAVTFTRMQRNQAELDRERDRLATPWRAAFAVAFLLALLAASRTGPSFVTTTAVILAVASATVYLVRRKFFAILKETGTGDRRRSGQAWKTLSERGLEAALEGSLERETDPSRRSTLLLQIGLFHAVRGNYDDAVRAFERIDRSQREGALRMSVVVDVNIATILVAKGDFDAADAALARIDPAHLTPDFKILHDTVRSALLVGRGAYAESIRFVDGLSMSDLPGDKRLAFLRDLAESLASSGAEQRAIEVASQCLEIDAGAQSQNVMAFCLIAQKKVEEAIARLGEALVLNPDGSRNVRVFAESLYYLGLAKQAAGDIEAARDAFARAAGVRGGGRFALAAVERAKSCAATS